MDEDSTSALPHEESGPTNLELLHMVQRGSPAACVNKRTRTLCCGQRKSKRKLLSTESFARLLAHLSPLLGPLL